MTVRRGSAKSAATVRRGRIAEDRPGRVVRADIQALRAAAVTAVVLFHLAPGFFPGGFVGVDVFFVVSGFLVGGALARQVLENGSIQLWQFFARRARRIAPLSAVVATVTIVWAALVMSPLDLTLWGPPALTPTVTRDGLASLLGIPNLWIGVSAQGYLTTASPSPFTHYWSLGVEEQFYLVVPFVLLLVFGKFKQFRAGLLVLVALSILSFDLAVSGWTVAGVGPFFNPLTRAWELAAGLLAALVAHRVASRLDRSRTPLVVAGWMGLGFVAFAVSGSLWWPRPITLVPVLCTVIVLVVGAARPAGRVAELGVVRWAGDRSYGLYLWHWPFVILLLPALSFGTVGGDLVVVGCAVVASGASYRWIETPMRRLGVGTPRQARKTILISAGFVGVALIAVVVVGAKASTSDLAANLHARPYVATPAGAAGQTFSQVVPINVRPVLNKVAQDLPRANYDGCNVETGASDSAAPTNCVYGTTGPVIALFGDSHALQWLEALMPGVESGKYRVALVTADGCPPFETESVTDREACGRWQPAALAHVLELQPDLLLMSASTPRLTWDDAAQQSAAQDDINDLASALAGMKVAWIADTPHMQSPPDRCAADDVHDISACSTTRSDALSGNARYVIEDAAEAHDWVWLDLNDYLCDSERCGIILGDVFLYRDEDHITATFSTELAPPLDALVAPLLGS